LDGITDPRNLGAIIRSVAAFGGHGVVVPQRRSVGMTASAWKTSAGAAARVKVAQAGNLTQALKDYRKAGFFIIGLDMHGDVELPDLELASEPLVVVVGSEGKGLSRLVAETCDQIVSVPMSSAVESLNAGIATGVTLYEVAPQARPPLSLAARRPAEGGHAALHPRWGGARRRRCGSLGLQLPGLNAQDRSASDDPAPFLPAPTGGPEQPGLRPRRPRRRPTGPCPGCRRHRRWERRMACPLPRSPARPRSTSRSSS
jgi:tRNA(Leu) C34 or U34 (ribose-2'-O)-methylase TrmL